MPLPTDDALADLPGLAHLPGLAQHRRTNDAPADPFGLPADGPASGEALDFAAAEQPLHKAEPQASDPRRRAGQWTVSLAVHGAVLVALLLVHTAPQAPPQRIEWITGVVEDMQEEETERLDWTAEIDSVAPSLENAVHAAASAPAAVAEAAAGLPTRADADSAAVRRILDRDSLVRPLSLPGGFESLGENVTGAVGVSALVADGAGDAGSIDRITQEILRQLEKNKVIVTWVLDSSGSMAGRRERIVRRFQKVYDELDELGASGEGVLLTNVVGFGKRTQFLTPKPTDDRREIMDAVRAITADDSGEENVFTAVQQTAVKYGKWHSRGRWTVMLVVLTDETGADRILLDETVKLTRRYRMPVYVLGTMAPFGREQVQVPWVDEPTGERFLVPVDRGPESIQPEHLALPYWFDGPQFDLFASGFGPYGLTRLARETGGIYFVFDDSALPGPVFDPYDLLEYQPDYVSYRDYIRQMNEHPLRVAVVRTVQTMNDSRDLLGGQPRMRFGVADLNPQLQRAARTAAQTQRFVDQALAQLRPVERHRDGEPSRRWQAHFDLIMGRLLATRVRCNEYNWALGQMRVNPRVPAGKTGDKPNNAWSLKSVEDIRFGSPLAGADRSGRVDKDTLQAQADAEAAREYLQRVVTDHPDTPWSLMAGRELSAPMGFDWVERHEVPPEEREQAENPDDPAAAERARRRAEAAKRVPKL